MDAMSNIELTTEIASLKARLAELERLQVLRVKQAALLGEVSVVTDELKAVEKKTRRLEIYRPSANIPLGGWTYGIGVCALVDARDEAIALSYKWTMNKVGYIATTGGLYLHQVVIREAGIAVPPGYEIHHKNSIKHDNRRENLAVITVALNRSIKRTYKNNKTGWPGVTQRSSDWWVKIARSHKIYRKYGFTTFEAAKAWQIAAVAEWESTGIITV